MKHGAGGKWYYNAKNYSNELAKELDLERYLTEQWRFFETLYIRKFMGGLVSSSGLGYKLRLPIIGRVLRYEVENMALTAWDLGIGSCWIGAYNEEVVKALLGVPKHLRFVSLLTLGYPDMRAGPKHRKEPNDIFHFHEYGVKEH